MRHESLEKKIEVLNTETNEFREVEWNTVKKDDIFKVCENTFIAVEDARQSGHYFPDGKIVWSVKCEQQDYNNNGK